MDFHSIATATCIHIENAISPLKRKKNYYILMNFWYKASGFLWFFVAKHIHLCEMDMSSSLTCWNGIDDGAITITFIDAIISFQKHINF